MRFGIKTALRRFFKIAPEDTLQKALQQVRSLDEYAVVVDVGANSGQSARHFLKLFPRATIYCLEPDPRAFAELTRFAELEPRVRPHNLALAERSEERQLNINAVSTTNSFLNVAPTAGLFIDPGLLRQMGMCTVRTMTLPEFCSMVGIEKIDLLKLDTQGFEDRILLGCKDWLAPSRIGVIKTEVLFMRHYENQAEADVVMRLLREKGFKLHSFHDLASRSQIGLMWGDALFVQSEHAC